MSPKYQNMSARLLNSAPSLRAYRAASAQETMPMPVEIDVEKHIVQ
jgi:hypothetical protein